MNVPRYAAAAAKLLTSWVRPATLVAGDRDRGVATIERAMQARSRRRSLMWVTAAMTAAAALVLIAWGARRVAVSSSDATLVAINVSPAGRGAELVAGASDRPLPERAALGAGQRIETPADGGAALKLSTGTSIDLAGSTAFRVDSQGLVERFSLQRGALSAHVAKLTSGQRFIVATPDAEVEVRGTRFTVRVLEQGQACGDGSRTRLAVTEGVVELRGKTGAIRVAAGEFWPSDCAMGAEAPAASAAVVATEPARGAAVRAPRLAGMQVQTPGSGSEGAAQKRDEPERASALAEQNDLFAQGVALRRQGDTSGALRVYRELIARYPRSPLAENALVERMRLLAATHDPLAGDEARRYLARYPHGFGAKEAEQLAAGP